PDHAGERKAELGGAHGAGERDQHLPAIGDVAPVRLGGGSERRGAEMPEVPADEFAHCAHRCGSSAEGAGICCVRQWKVPSPTTSARASIGTMRRPGKERARSATAASSSSAAPKVGTSTTRLPI